jgi:hypothetical protein
MLREQRGSRASARLQRGRFSPSLLLSGLDPSCEVEVAVSDLRQPSEQQLSQLWALLAASQARRVSVALVSESSEQLPQRQLDGIARATLCSLLRFPGLAGRLLQLDAHTGAPVDGFQLSHQLFGSLRKLHFDPSPAQLPGLASLQGLEVLCISLDRAAWGCAGGCCRRMQRVLDALGALRRLQDLTMDGFLEGGGGPLVLPPWAGLTRLVAGGGAAWSGPPKLLPAPLRACLQELYLAPVAAAEGGAASGAPPVELPAVTQFVLSAEQLALGVPAMPRLARLHVDGRVAYARLLEVLEGMPSLQVGWRRAACRARRPPASPPPHPPRAARGAPRAALTQARSAHLGAA